MNGLRYYYEALIYPSGNGYEVQVPDLDAFTQGDDLDDAVMMSQGLVETLVSAMVDDGDVPPSATFVRKAPDGGYVLLVTTDGNVPEVPDMSVQDAADVLGVSASRVYAMCRDGVLDSRKVGSTVLVSAESVKKRSATIARRAPTQGARAGRRIKKLPPRAWHAGTGKDGNRRKGWMPRKMIARMSQSRICKTPPRSRPKQREGSDSHQTIEGKDHEP